MTRKVLHRMAILAVLLGVVNLTLWAEGAWGISRLYFSAIVFICAWPAIQLVTDPNVDLPGFPVILLIYGGYYGLMGLVPFDPYKNLALVSESALQEAGLLGFLGVLALQLGYRLGGGRRNKYIVAKDGELEFSLSRVSILGVIGVLGWVAAYAASIPVVVRSLATLASELLILAFIVLLEAQLRGSLGGRWKILNWCIFAPTVLITALGVSKLFPIVRIILILLVVYFFVRRRVPWKSLIISLVLLFPVFLLKVGIRQFDAATNKIQNQTLSSTKERLALYWNVFGEFQGGMNSDLFQMGLTATANRFDLTRTFAYVIDKTPTPVPYLEGETYKSLIWKLVPRAIYPQKSIENWGNKFGHRYGMLAANDDDTSINVPQMIEWYVNFGYLGVIWGMLGIGVIYGILKSSLYRDGTFVQGVFTIFIFSQLFNIESNFSLVFGSLPYSLPLYVLLGRWALDRTGKIEKLTIQSADAGGPLVASKR